MFALRRISVALLPAIGLLTGVNQARADKQSQAVYQRTLRSTGFVLARIPGTKDGGTGSGWIISRSQRLLITNHHVILVKGKLVRVVDVVFPSYSGGRVIADGTFYTNPRNRAEVRSTRGKVLYSDPKRDLALIRLDAIPSDITALKIASSSPAPGERVHSVGNPSAARPGMWIYTVGNVRQVFRRKMNMTNGQKVDARIVLTQSPINPGDSGGPVVNDRAELVGVTSSVDTVARLITNFIDVSEVMAFWRDARASRGGSFASR